MSMPGAYLQQLLQQLQLGGSISGLGAGLSGIGAGTQRPPQTPIQRPQLTQIPQMLPAAPGFNPAAGPGGTAPGNMPFIRNAAMSQVLGPLMQQNYGLPIISPFGQPGAPAGPALGLPLPGLKIPSQAGIGGGIPRAFTQ